MKTSAQASHPTLWQIGQRASHRKTGCLNCQPSEPGLLLAQSCSAQQLSEVLAPVGAEDGSPVPCRTGLLPASSHDWFNGHLQTSVLTATGRRPAVGNRS